MGSQGQASGLRNGRRLLVMTAMYFALLFGYPNLARDGAEAFFSTFDPFHNWERGQEHGSPDGRLVAAQERLDRGGLGWGPRRVIVAPVDDRDDEAVVFDSPDRWWPLTPRWKTDGRLEVLVTIDREPTLAEQAEARRTVRVEGRVLDVSVLYRERGEP